MLDCQLYDLRAGGHHLTNLLLHAAATILLFLVLRRMTGDLWPSAFAAALFAVHPLHVESVAWIAERKDVLSGLFFMLTLAAYLGYVRHSFSRARYLIVTVSFALGLMAKPMLVTLPFVLLLLDYWPLKRFASWRRLLPLLAEKAPLFVLSAVAGVITLLVQRAGGAMISLEDSPLAHRFGAALLGYFFYLGKTFWPAKLFVPYWYEFKPEILPLAGALAAFTAVTGGVIWLGRRFRYLPVGWLWYVGTLVPVIGIIHVGSQSAADRYTYLPSTGILLMVVWGAAELFQFIRPGRWWPVATAVTVFTACGILTFRQLGYWRNSITLFSHTLAADPPNLVAMNLLAWTYATDLDPRLRDPAKALDMAALTTEITMRRHAVSLRVLAAAQAEAGRFQAAAATAREALALPDAAIQPYLIGRLRRELQIYEAGRAIRSR
jgi:hypothetical protein